MPGTGAQPKADKGGIGYLGTKIPHENRGQVGTWRIIAVSKYS